MPEGERCEADNQEKNMARLTNCRDCGHRVSKTAESCPNCGARFIQRWNEIRGKNISGGVSGVIAVIILLMLLAAMIG